MKDFRTSILVNNQVPQFIREDYPKFITFLEAYYEFLENEQFNSDLTSQNNDVTVKLKSLRELSDVSQSLDNFEDQFFNTYAPLIPKDVSVDKEFLIKHVLELYKSKGSIQSFHLFFKLLFGEDIVVKTPKDNILRASDGRWVLENVIRVSPLIQTNYTGDGETTDFFLAQEVNEDDITVLVDNVLQSSGYFVKKELRKLVFLVPPSLNSQIDVNYLNFDSSLLINRKAVGALSGASIIIERADSKIFGQENYLQIYFNKKSLSGEFRNGEYLLCDFFDEAGTLINVKLLSLSYVTGVTITNPGASYNVGDPALVVGPSTRQARIIVDSVERGVIEQIEIEYGGAGFKLSNNVRAIGVDETAFKGIITAVDDSGFASPNTVTINTDLIYNYSNVVLSNLDFGFPAVGSENINSVIANTLTYTTITGLGPATLINVSTSFLTTTQDFNIEPVYPVANGIVWLDGFGMLGRIDIVDGGSGYQVNDNIVFTRQYGDFSSRDASAIVAGVDGGGAITQIAITNVGLGFDDNIFPIVTVASNTGSNAVLVISSIMGDGEQLNGLLPVDEQGRIKYAGEIKSLKILDPGLGYDILPFVDLSLFGNKQATADLVVTEPYEELPGRWTTSDSILSSEDRRLQGRDYYVNYAYVINSKLEFSRYKKLLLDIIHPSGMNPFAECDLSATIPYNANTNIYPKIVKTISGRVNTNSSVYVEGTNTMFVLANTNNILTPGSIISINNETQVVNVILSNTMFTTVNAFSFTANTQSIIIL